MKDKLKKFLIILNIVLVIIIITSAIYTHNLLSLGKIQKEIHNIFGKDYEITIHKLTNNDFTVSASIPEEKLIDIDYTEKVDLFTDAIKGYKSNSKITRLVMLVGYHAENIKYIDIEKEINLSK